MLHRMSFLATLLMGISTASFTVADEPDEEANLVSRWYTAYDEIHQSFELQIEAADGEWSKVDSPATPAMTLLRPGRRARHGRVWVWSYQKRPVAVACIWSELERSNVKIRNVAFEFHSLTDKNLRLDRNGMVEWQASQPGLEWMEVDSVRPPDERASLRLTQMRAISREISVGREASKSTPPRGHDLLTQPIHRYSDDKTGTDGAIFVYGDTTDPQVFLLVEARGEKWQMAFARSNVLGLYADSAGERIWSCKRATSQVRKNPFFIFFFAERRSATDPSNILRVVRP